MATTRRGKPTSVNANAVATSPGRCGDVPQRPS